MTGNSNIMRTFLYNLLRYNFIVFNQFLLLISLHRIYNTLGYEPADLTVHPPPPELQRVSSFFFVMVSSVPKKMSSKESL